MTTQKKQQILDCSDFEQLLDAEYGKRGVPKRESFEASAEAFCLGECLKEQRLAAGLTQRQLAEQTGTQASTISRVEKGCPNVSINTIFHIFAGMGRRVSFTVL